VDARSARTIAAAVAAVAVASCVCLILLFIVGGPFGALNDAGNGLLALLCAALAITLHQRGGILATTLAIAGAATAVLGSYLVITDTTGYFLAGLVSALGFALIGSWLVIASRFQDLPAARGALTAGAVMALGFVNLAGILQGVDEQETTPTWLLAAGICWAGTYVLLPLWALRFARTDTKPDGVPAHLSP